MRSLVLTGGIAPDFQYSHYSGTIQFGPIRDHEFGPFVSGQAASRVQDGNGRNLITDKNPGSATMHAGCTDKQTGLCPRKSYQSPTNLRSRRAGCGRTAHRHRESPSVTMSQVSKNCTEHSKACAMRLGSMSCIQRAIRMSQTVPLRFHNLSSHSTLSCSVATDEHQTGF